MFEIEGFRDIVSRLYIYIYIYIYIRKFVWAQYNKSKLGITQFAHNYMETSHVASKPKLLKTLARSGI